jgi:hypothetical protein
MASDGAPAVIAHDGSELSRAAVRHAAELFAGRRAVLATVWEPACPRCPWAASTRAGEGRSLPIRRLHLCVAGAQAITGLLILNRSSLGTFMGIFMASFGAIAVLLAIGVHADPNERDHAALDEAARPGRIAAERGV